MNPVTLTLALTVLGLLVTVLGLALALLSHRHQMRIAGANKTFSKPDLTISPENMEGAEEIYFSLPLRKGAVVTFKYPFVIHNEGGKTADDVFVVIRANKLLIPIGDLESSTPGIRHEIEESGNFVTICIEVKRLNPDSRVEINLPFALGFDTSNESALEVTSADNIRMKVAYSYTYRFQIQCTISWRDAMPVSQIFGVVVWDTNKKSPEERIEEFAAQGNKKLSSMPMLERVRQTIRGNFAKTRRVALARLDLGTADGRGGEGNSLGQATIEHGVRSDYDFFITSMIGKKIRTNRVKDEEKGKFESADDRS